MNLPDIVKIIDWSPDRTLEQLHEKMIELMQGTFARHGSSPASWLLAHPDGHTAALFLTPWKNNAEKRRTLRSMHWALNHGPDERVIPAYAFSCEALMAVKDADDPIPGSLKNDPTAEDVAFVSSYDRHGRGLFTRFGVGYGADKEFGTLKARDDWDLGKPDATAQLGGLLINVYLPDPDNAAPEITCPHCGKLCDARQSLDDDSDIPKDGDILLCMACGEVGTYDASEIGGARKASRAELAEFMADPRIRLGSQLIKAVRARQQQK